MAFVPVANCVLAEMLYTYHGESCENTLWFHNILEWDESMMLDLAGDLLDWWQGEIQPIVTNQLQFRGVRVTDMATQTGPVVEINVTGELGALVSQGTPGSVSLAVSFRTNKRGRSFRGRNYWMGLTEDQVAQNEVIPTAVLAIVDAYNDLSIVITNPDTRHVVVSRFSGKLPDGKPAPRVNGIFTNVTSYSADGFVDSQRRRLAGRGS